MPHGGASWPQIPQSPWDPFEQVRSITTVGMLCKSAATGRWIMCQIDHQPLFNMGYVLLKEEQKTTTPRR
jgi:hypothetical protein